MVEFYILEQGGAVKRVGVRQASGDPAARASSWRLLGAQLSCQASSTLQLAGVDSNKSSILVLTWCLVFSKRCS